MYVIKLINLIRNMTIVMTCKQIRFYMTHEHFTIKNTVAQYLHQKQGLSI